MKNYFFAFVILISVFLSFAFKGNPGKNGRSRYETIVNLDIECPTKTLSMKIIYDTKKFENNGNQPASKKNIVYPDYISDIFEGPGSTFYTLDIKNRRVVQFSQNGDYLNSIGSHEAKEGKIKNPVYAVGVPQKNIYIAEAYGKELHVLDYNGKYLRTLNNMSIYNKYFSIGRNGSIYTTPKFDEFLLLFVYDHNGNVLRKMAPVKMDEHGFFRKGTENHFHIDKSYYILTNENTNYVWCVFRDTLLIKKYDLEGNYIDEITIESKVLDTLINKRKYNEEKIKKFGLLPANAGNEKITKPEKKVDNDNSKDPVVTVKEVFIDDAKIMLNGNLLLHIPDLGNIELSGDDKPTTLVRKYEISILSEKSDPGIANNILLYPIHGIFYGTYFSFIAKEK